jgi:hypothetical protein
MDDLITENSEMLFAFPDGSASFVNGFEAGMIWQRIESGEAAIDCGVEEGFPIHSENVELIARMAACRGYRLETHDAGAEGWTAARLTLAPVVKPVLKVVPHD